MKANAKTISILFEKYDDFKDKTGEILGDLKDIPNEKLIDVEYKIDQLSSTIEELDTMIDDFKILINNDIEEVEYEIKF